MSLPRPTLTIRATADVCAAMFEPAGQQCVGVELEWPVHRSGNVARRPTGRQMSRLASSALPAGGRVTFEPGGQVELSTAPAASVRQALDAADLDIADLSGRLQAAGLVRETLAVDTRRPPRRVLERPRYAAMESFFGASGPAGRWMMCNTASTQVNISHDPADPYERWFTMHRIAPVLIAAFANSPGRDLHGQHWSCLRQGIWASIDPARTRPVRGDRRPDQAWHEYALAADVMFMGDGADGGTAVAPGLPFGRWMTDGHSTGWPTVEDFRYHLSTLFPPVRPRGWLELRVLDALPDWIRDAAVLTVAAACTPDAGRELRQRLPDTGSLWLTAARDGIAHPALAQAARTLADVVSEHLPAVSADSRDHSVLAEFTDCYLRAGRAPGTGRTSSTAGLTAQAPELTGVGSG
jgi:glutamate--cysteine ligase